MPYRVSKRLYNEQKLFLDHLQNQLNVIINNLAHLSKQLKQLEQKEIKMSNEMDLLAADVAANSAEIASAVGLIDSIAADLAAAKGNPAAVQALADKLSASTMALKAAVDAHTAVIVPVVAAVADAPAPVQAAVVAAVADAAPVVADAPVVVAPVV